MFTVAFTAIARAWDSEFNNKDVHVWYFQLYFLDLYLFLLFVLSYVSLAHKCTYFFKALFTCIVLIDNYTFSNFSVSLYCTMSMILLSLICILLPSSSHPQSRLWVPLKNPLYTLNPTETFSAIIMHKSEAENEYGKREVNASGRPSVQCNKRKLSGHHFYSCERWCL